ncbi:MAG TPA: hypothetical protein PLX79_00865 [Candidatus Dojkabacteria bacterium]|nr:hypothetical protein [Candidatus Dojkabacteria bacterium]
MIKKLNFSNEFFEVSYINDQIIESIDNFTIVVNLSKNPIKVDFVSEITQDKSFMLHKCNKPLKVNECLLVKYNFDPSIVNLDLQKFCTSNWNNNKIRYPEDPSKWNYAILRSPIDKLGKFEFNCWYLPKNTASSIHNEHSFTEVHTQIYGLGIMNKFSDNNKESLYQRMYMAPGFTHDYFFNNEIKYPWHQYEAVSECIWMAICKYK